MLCPTKLSFSLRKIFRHQTVPRNRPLRGGRFFFHDPPQREEAARGMAEVFMERIAEGELHDFAELKIFLDRDAQTWRVPEDSDSQIILVNSLLTHLVEVIKNNYQDQQRGNGKRRNRIN